MLVQFFRTSFAGQYIAAGVFALLVWGTVLAGPPPMPAPEGPAILYQLLYDLLAGFPVMATLCGLAVTITAAIWLNLLLSRHDIVPKHSSLTTFLFILMACSHPSLMTLTPVSIPLLLLISVLQSLLQSYNRSEPVELTFSAGFMVAVSALFYLPSLLFYGFLLTTFLIFRTIKWREWAGSFIGLLTPVLFLATFWFWTDQVRVVLADYARFFEALVFTNPWKEAGRAIPALFLLLFFLLGLVHNFRHRSEKTVETRKKLMLMSWLAVWVLLTVPFAGSYLFYHPMLATLTAAPFLANVYLSKKKPFLWEILLWIFIFMILWNQLIYLLP